MSTVNKKQRVIVMVVARMGSTRLPGKSMTDLCGHPVIWHVLQIAKNIRGACGICLATTDMPEDDPLVLVAQAEGIHYVRGDAEKVLDRLYDAAVKVNADVIIEIGGDCPLLDPEIVNSALEEFLALRCDYLCNYEPPTFPEGMDINIVKMSALEKAWRNAVAPSQRIHPFSYLTYHPEEFVIRNYVMTPDLSHHHWSLDFPEDVELIRIVYEKLWKNGRSIHLNELIHLLDVDKLFFKKDKELLRPKVSHAFWNSPGIILDMHSDVVALTHSAAESQRKGDFIKAKQNYAEVLRIVGRLNSSGAK
jgi:spore coat polysaccharide biosynthesis protein SpsF